MPQPYTLEQQKAIALAKARKRKAQAMSAPGPEIGPMNQTAQMPFTVQQMPMDARRDWMEANAPNAVTQPQRGKTGIGEAVMLGTVDMGGPAATAPAAALGADVDADMSAALQDRPVSYRMGQGLSLAAGPGAIGWKAGEKGLTMLGSKLSPALGVTSKSIGDKAARYLGRGAGLGFLGLAENFGFNTLAEGRNQNRQDTGESQGMGDIGRGLEVAKDDAFNPIAAVAPAAASGIFRVGKYAKSGGQSFTPDAVAARVDQALTPSSGQTLPATLVGAIDPAAERQLVRLLSNEGGFGKDDITAALTAFEQSIEGGMEGAALASRLKDVLAEQLGERARKPIDDFLQGAGNRKGGESGRIVGETVAEDAPRLSQFLEDSANSRFGSANRYDTLEAAEQEMERIGQEGYETVFRNQPTNRPGVESLKEAVQFFAGSELSKPLRQIAAGKMMDIDQMIQVDPRRAAHWMQHTANLKARQASDAGDTVLANAYRDMREQLLRRLEADGVAPGYKKARMEFGDEFSNASALNFGDRFVTVADDQMKLGKLLKEMEGMTPTEREAAFLSIRDAVLKPAMRKTEGGLPRMAIIGREPVLNALERLGPEGTAFANDVRKTAERVRRTQQIDPRTGSNTMNKQEAAQFAEKSVANPLVRALGNTMQNMGGDAAISGATGVFSPVMTGRALLRKGGDMLANGRQGKIDALTELLTRDVGSAPRAPMSGDPTAGPANALGGSGGGSVSQSPAQQGVNALAPVKAGGNAGFIRPDGGDAIMSASGAVTGGTFAPDMDGDGSVSLKERLAAGLAGGAAGYGLSRGGGAALKAIPPGYAARMEQAADVESIVNVLGTTHGKPKTRFIRAATAEEVEDASLQAIDDIAEALRSKGLAPDGATGRHQAQMHVMDGTRGPDDVPIRAFRQVARDRLAARGLEAPEELLRGESAMTNRGEEMLRGRLADTLDEVRGNKPVTSAAEEMPRRGDQTQQGVSSRFNLEGWEPPTSSSGIAVNGDAGNALVGGAIGGAMPADSQEERLRNMAVFAGGAATTGRLDRLLPKRGASGAGASGGGKPPPIKPDVPLGKGPKNGNRLGRGLEDLVREQNAPRIPKPPPMEPRRPSNALAAQEAPQAAPVPRKSMETPAHGDMGALGLLGIPGGLAAIFYGGPMLADAMGERERKQQFQKANSARETQLQGVRLPQGVMARRQELVQRVTGSKGQARRSAAEELDALDQEIDRALAGFPPVPSLKPNRPPLEQALMGNRR